MRARLSVALAAACLLLAIALPATANAELIGAAETQARFDGIPQHGRTLGDPKAPVTLEVFIELKCPFCRAFDAKVLPTVIHDYVRAGKVRVVAEPVSFIGPDSDDAAAMTVAMGLQNKFWNFADLFYANQQDESEVYATDDYLLGIAAGVPGADGARALADSSGKKVKKSLANSQKLMNKRGVSGTPSVFISRTGGPVNEIYNQKRDVLRAIRKYLR